MGYGKGRQGHPPIEVDRTRNGVARAEARHYETWNRNSVRERAGYVLDVKGVITWKYLRAVVWFTGENVRGIHIRTHASHTLTFMCEYVFARTAHLRSNQGVIAC